jgi:protein SHQ1
VHINPYFLRLNFSDSLIEDDASSANYDPSSGYLTLALTKESPGKEFKDLDLLSKLLAPRPSVSAQPNIEVLSTEPTPGESDISTLVQSLSLQDKELLEGTLPVLLEREMVI